MTTPPTAQTSLLALPHPPLRWGPVVPLAAEAAHAVPSQCRIVPPSPTGPAAQPTAQTSLLALPHTLGRKNAVPLAATAHALSSERRIMPLWPTAQTSLLALPHTPESGLVPLEEADHPLPSQCKIVPPGPTVQTSLLALPHTL